MYELPYKIKKICCHVVLWIEHSIIFFCCSKLCYQAFKYHFESCMCHVDFVYKAMISSKEIRRTGNDMKATVRFNVFLNVQNLILSAFPCFDKRINCKSVTQWGKPFKCINNRCLHKNDKKNCSTGNKKFVYKCRYLK